MLANQQLRAKHINNINIQNSSSYRDNITIETGRSGIPEYKGVDMGRDGLPLENISMNTIIDSLNSTMEMRTKNRRIKIIFTQQNYVDGTTPYKTPEKFR